MKSRTILLKAVWNQRYFQHAALFLKENSDVKLKVKFSLKYATALHIEIPYNVDAYYMEISVSFPCIETKGKSIKRYRIIHYQNGKAITEMDEVLMGDSNEDEVDKKFTWRKINILSKYRKCIDGKDFVKR